MKIHKLNLENNYRNLVDSAIAVKAGLTPAVFAARPTYNDVLLGFNDGETPTLLLPKWAQFTIDLSKNKPSWAPASLTGTLTVTITPSVVGVTAEEDEVALGNVDVYGVPVASTGKQFKVNEGFYSIGLNVMVVDEDNVPVIAYSDGRPMKVAMQKVADNGPDTSVDVAGGQSVDVPIESISVNGVEVLPDENKNIDIEIPEPEPYAPMIEKTWAELKELRDNAQLIPGQSYRITDYVYVAKNGDSYHRSANKPFDVIVVADDESHLNENARAIQHEGDTYFANCNLAAWKLWYCLDNYDTVRGFGWVNETNGKGVIYRMIDAWGNDCPYDFKNVLFSYEGRANSPYLFTFNASYTSFANAVDKSTPSSSQSPHPWFCKIEPRLYLDKLALTWNFIIGTRAQHCHIRGGSNVLYEPNNVKLVNSSICVLGNSSSFSSCQNVELVNCTKINSNVAENLTGVNSGYVTFNLSNNTRYIAINGYIGDYSTPITINNAETNQTYTTTYFRDVDGTLKVQKGSTITTVE